MRINSVTWLHISLIFWLVEPELHVCKTRLIKHRHGDNFIKPSNVTHINGLNNNCHSHVESAIFVSTLQNLFVQFHNVINSTITQAKQYNWIWNDLQVQTSHSKSTSNNYYLTCLWGFTGVTCFSKTAYSNKECFQIWHTAQDFTWSFIENKT